MAPWGTAFDLLSWVYLAAGVATVWRLARAGGRTFDGELTAADRRLVGGAAFYLATPAAVALHELGHWAVIRALGGHVVDWHFLGYWGYVVPDRSFGPYGDLAVALAGNVVTAVIGVAAAWHALHRPGKAAWNFFWWRLGEIQLSIVLFFYPLLCLLGFGGDFTAIYRVATWPVSAPLLVFHLAALALALHAMRGPLGARARFLTGPLWDEVRRQEATLAHRPDDVCARIQIAWAHLAAGFLREALPHAEAALKLRPDLPAARAVLGQALCVVDPARAAAELRAACSAQDLDPLLRETSERSLGAIEAGVRPT